MDSEGGIQETSSQQQQSRMKSSVYVKKKKNYSDYSLMMIYKGCCYVSEHRNRVR